MIAAAFVAVIFLPSLLGIDGMSSGYAISFISFFIAISSLVVVYVYRGMTTIYDKIVGGEGVLAHWNYDPELWMKYSKTEYGESISEVKPLFYLTSGMCLIAGVGAFIWDPEAGIYVLGIMLVTIGLMGLAALLTRNHLNHDNLRKPGDAIISKRGVVLNNRLFYWDYFGARLEKVRVRTEKDYSTLIFITWAPTMTFGQSYTLRIPIPPREEEKASEIASILNH
jgi:hypothetical protein